MCIWERKNNQGKNPQNPETPTIWVKGIDKSKMTTSPKLVLYKNEIVLDLEGKM